MFLCEAGKIENSKLELYDLKLLEFKDLKKNSPVSGILCLKHMHIFSIRTGDRVIGKAILDN